MLLRARRAAAAARSLYELRRDQPFQERKGQESKESEAKDDEDDSGHLLTRLGQATHGTDRSTERDENEREAEHEREARRDHAPAADAGLRPGHDREVAGDEWEDAGRHERDHPGQKDGQDFSFHQL